MPFGLGWIGLCPQLGWVDWPTACVVVIPCLNEQAGIGAVVAGARRFLPSVLVVDDGSEDQTAEIAAKAGARVQRHPINRGKGSALQTGWKWAADQGFQWAMCLDGDGQHSPEDIPAFLRCAEATGAALIIGNRMKDNAQMPALRRFVNRWMSRRLSRLTGHDLPDSQCGFRLMNLEAWRALSIRTARFEIESETLLEFIAAGYRVEFVPIRVIYKNEQSKIHPVHDSLRWWRWWRRAKTTRR